MKVHSKNMNKVIILGNDHTNTLGLTQVLGRGGYYVIACVWGEKRGLVETSRYCKEIYGGLNPEVCIGIICSFSSENDSKKIPIIASCDDAALALERNRNILKDRFVFEYTTGPYTIEQLLEKKLQVRLATEAGFNVPRSWQLNALKKDNGEVKYPILIKPLVSAKGAKEDIRISKNKDELEANLASLHCTKEVIAQQYIDHDFEISILGCGLSNGDVMIPCVENKLSLYPLKVGLECLAKMQPLTDETIISPITKLVRQIGYVGLFSVEMMHNREDDKFYFTEINLRNDGANSFVYKYGVNLPLMHIEDLQGSKQQKSPTEVKPGYYIWDMHHFLSLIHRDISVLKWIQELRKSNGFLTYFQEDTKPFYRQYRNWLLQKLQIRKKVQYK